MLIVGEVHTGLLRNRGELSETQCRQALDLISGEPPLTSLRPLLYASSPDVLAGVDCHLPSLSGARARSTGTVTLRATITGGRVVQTSSYALITSAEHDRRMPWSHYLARPGQIEVRGKARWGDMTDGFMAPRLALDALDLGAISGRLMNAVQGGAPLDGRTPFKSARTRLRWVLAPSAGEADDQPLVHLTLWKGALRTLRLTGEPTPRILTFCEDLALHDWLLTTLQALVERALIGTAKPAQTAAKLAPATEHLLHLWMPGVRTAERFHPFWEELEKYPGFTRQWTSSVARIRDQIAVNTLSLLSVMAESRREADGKPSWCRGAPPDTA